MEAHAISGIHIHIYMKNKLYFQASYQKQATVLWRITRNCSGTYWWFTHPTTGQNCTYNSSPDINYMATPLCYRITPKLTESKPFNVTYCPRRILNSWIFLLDFRFHMDPRSPCAYYRIKVNNFFLIRLMIMSSISQTWDGRTGLRRPI